MDNDTAESSPPGRYVYTEEAAQAWEEKGRQWADRMLPLAGDVARPGQIRHDTVTDPANWPYGRFMAAWIDESVEPRRLCHLPEADFFIALLKKAYSSVLDGHPERAKALEGLSRLEMSLTNDALQAQLVTLTPGYAMIRHHSLMLFEAALWLDEPERSAWLDIYDAMVDDVDAQPGGRPSLEEIADVERGAMADFVELAADTIDPSEALALLDDPSDILRRVIDYQRYAAAGIGLLWRSYREVPEDQRDDWHRENLSIGYVKPDYLETEWTTAP